MTFDDIVWHLENDVTLDQAYTLSSGWALTVRESGGLRTYDVRNGTAGETFQDATDSLNYILRKHGGSRPAAIAELGGQMPDTEPPPPPPPPPEE